MPSLKAPRNLSPEARGWWHKIAVELEADDAQGFLLLKMAMESFDEMRRAQAIIAKDGPITTDRWGQTKQHPAVLCVRDARNHMLRALKDLGLEPAAAVGHPHTSV